MLGLRDRGIFCIFYVNPQWIKLRVCFTLNLNTFSAENPCFYQQSSGRKHRQRNFIISRIAPRCVSYITSSSFLIYYQSALLFNCNHVLLAFLTVTLAARLWDVMRLIILVGLLKTRSKYKHMPGQRSDALSDSQWNSVAWIGSAVGTAHEITKTEDFASYSGQATLFLLSLLA